jgi:hypothetical protein
MELITLLAIAAAGTTLWDLAARVAGNTGWA